MPTTSRVEGAAGKAPMTTEPNSYTTNRDTIQRHHELLRSLRPVVAEFYGFGGPIDVRLGSN